MIIRHLHKKAILTASVSLFLVFSCNHMNNPEVTVDELKDHIEYLASDSLNGRLTGSRGDSLAAEYIRSQLVSAGFIPVSDAGLQKFRVTKRIVAGKGNKLSINGNEFKPETDFMPSAFTSDGSLDAEVVFAGYGFNIKTDSLQWEDFKGLDVKNKWVLILKADPETNKPASAFLPFSGDRDKALVAKDMGAAGVLMVAGKFSDPEDAFEPLSSEGYSVDIPVFRIKRELADIILSAKKTNINSLEEQLRKTRKPSVFNTGATVSGKAELKRETAATRNVVMELPGEDSVLKNEYIVIGAHFDHLGMGGQGSSSRAVDTTGIHHGADDNASGVAMMLELAEKFAGTPGSHKRSVICVAFTGEEEGLLGSKHFVEDPGIDLTKVNAMINLDMVGRLNEHNMLQISGVGTAEGLKELLISKTDTSVVKLALSDEGYGPSDHSSFYGKNIPVLFYFTGAHADYHTPADTWDKINYEGMLKISDLTFSMASELASEQNRLKFREAGPKVSATRRMKGVTLGIMPDFAGVVKNGLRADFVTPGRPAALGGMKKGDIIIAIEGKPVNNIQDYMFRMGQCKKGQTISVDVLRNNNKVGLLIQL
jgi:aminopeptidase YwaD